MSYFLTFATDGMTADKYDEVMKRLKASGAGNPKGRLYHVCYGDRNNLQVTDVWDTMENFQAFGETLMPLLQEMNINPGQPLPQPVHNIV